MGYRILISFRKGCIDIYSKNTHFLQVPYNCFNIGLSCLRNELSRVRSKSYFVANEFVSWKGLALSLGMRRVLAFLSIKWQQLLFRAVKWLMHRACLVPIETRASKAKRGEDQCYWPLTLSPNRSTVHFRFDKPLSMTGPVLQRHPLAVLYWTGLQLWASHSGYLSMNNEEAIEANGPQTM